MRVTPPVQAQAQQSAHGHMHAGCGVGMGPVSVLMPCGAVQDPLLWERVGGLVCWLARV